MKALPLILLFALALAALLLTHAATYQSPTFLEGWFFTLLWADIALVAVMTVVVGGFAVQLLIGWRRRAPGARLSLQLAGLFLAVALLPAAALYAVSAAGIFRGIESWFEAPLGRSLEKGIDFGQHVVGLEFERLERVSEDVAGQVGRRRAALLFLLDDLRLFHELEAIELFSDSGEVLVSSLTEAGTEDPRLDDGVLDKLRKNAVVVRLAGGGGNRRLEVIRRLRASGDAHALRLSRLLPSGIAEGIDEIERGREEYKKLQAVRSGLKKSFILTLTLAFVMVLLMVGWVSLRLSRRLTKPLVRMAEAAVIIGHGDFRHRLRATEGKDEMSQLARSFNAMADNLEQSRMLVGERQAALTKANARLENLLSSLSVGVLVFDAAGRLSHTNEGAGAILHASLSPLRYKTARQWKTAAPALSEFADLIGEAMQSPADAEQIEQRLSLADGKIMTVRVRRLSADAGGGWLAMVDDITRQMQTERAATWEEAARRFAHEIKNPLMPIQLAAERLGKKLEDKLSAPDGEMAARMISTITQQVAAMQKMVNSFREYSDRPEQKTELVDLNALILQVTPLYARPGLVLQKNLAEALPPVSGDGVALRQVLHNLVGNAVQATARTARPTISVATRAAGVFVVLTVLDNGGGVPEDILKKAFDPYVTTKSGGTGLGLAIVRKAAEDHGGRVELQNTGDGACAFLYLPCRSPIDANG